MATIQIPDALDQSLNQLAERHGFAKDDFIRDAVAQRLAEYDEEPELTPRQLAHLSEGVAQLRRGEFITSEQVDAKFDKLFKELEARAEVEELAIAPANR